MRKRNDFYISTPKNSKAHFTWQLCRALLRDHDCYITLKVGLLLQLNTCQPYSKFGKHATYVATKTNSEFTPDKLKIFRLIALL